MRNLRLIFGGVVLVIVTLLSFVVTPETSARTRSNEAYSWESYNTINGSLGAYNSFLENNTSYVIFSQDKSNPLMYTATVAADSCSSTIILTVDKANASKAKVSTNGNCPQTQGMDTTVRINNAPGAAATVQDEEDELKKSYTRSACREVSPGGTSKCTELAADKVKTIVASCKASHDYRSNLIKSNEYLDCIASALKVDRPDDDKKSKTTTSTNQSCQIPKVGWAICQMTEFVAQIADHTFSLLQPFLVIEPLKKEISTNANSSTYTAWGSIRDIANVLLIIGFLLVIFSQLTGIGIDTYHIKRNLPRIIVAAILINVSFFICTLFVDISNVVGRTAQDVTKYFASDVVSQSEIFNDWQSTSNRILTITPTDKNFNQQSLGVDPTAEAENEDEDDTTSNKEEEVQPTTSESGYVDNEEDTSMIINGVKITGAAVLYANLAILVPVMVFALFASFAALMVLLFRQAFVIILIILAPLAFAAIMLPGTKKWYTKWQSITVQLLLLYPIIALIFAASQLAAEVVRESAANNGHTLIAIFSLGIQVIPLFVTPLLLKFSGKAVNQFSGVVKGATSSPRKTSLSKANEFRRHRKQLQNTRLQEGRIGFGRFQVPGGKKAGQFLPSNVINSYKTGRRHRQAQLENDQQQAVSEGMGEYLKNVKDTDLVSAMTTEAAGQLHDIDVANVSAVANMYERQGVSQTALMSMAITGIGEKGEQLSEVEQRAAVRLAMQSATAEEAHQLLAAGAAGEVPQKVSQDISKEANAKGVSKESFEVSQSFLGNAALGTANKDDAMVGAIKSGRLNPESAPLQAPETMKRAQAALRSNESLDTNQRGTFTKTLARGLVSDSIGKGRKDTVNTMTEIINDEMKRGDVTVEDIASSISHGKSKPKADAYAKIFTEELEQGSFDMKKALKSKSFESDFYNDSKVMDSMLSTNLHSLEKAVDHVQIDELNDETLGFYKDTITYGFTTPAPTPRSAPEKTTTATDATLTIPEHFGSMEQFALKVSASLKNHTLKDKERALAQAIVSEYNKHAPAGREVRQSE